MHGELISPRAAEKRTTIEPNKPVHAGNGKAALFARDPKVPA
jgi:hypothetical protein